MGLRKAVACPGYPTGLKNRNTGAGGAVVLPTESRLWLAVQVVPQNEQKVATLLGHFGLEQFLPTVRTRREWSDRVKVKERPLLPGYVFCQAGRSSVGVILKTPGVNRIVTFGGKLYPVSDDEITALRTIVQAGRDPLPVPYVAVGEAVVVTAGPLKGLKGLVTQIKNKRRLIVSIESIMRSIAVEFSFSEISSIDC
jgi:transcription antitermination factor NusG